MEPKKSNRLSRLATTLLAAVCTAATLFMLAALLVRSAAGTSGEKTGARLDMMGKYDRYITNTISEALEGVLAIEKVYWLSDEDLVAPEPNPEGYGETMNPADLQPVIEAAEELLEGQELLFRTDVTLADGSKIKYYLDETILAITWKEQVGRTVFTFSEVKIKHPSQFRRFLAGGKFASGILYTTTEMAASVNAVTASSGDYYSYRFYGNSVYNGNVERAGDSLLETCYIDENGDLLFTGRGEVVKQAEVQRFVDENNVRFSLAFGPVLVNEEVQDIYIYYSAGQVTDQYSRAALCQHGPLHYVVVTANQGGLTVQTFAQRLYDRGIRKAYALDGGQTATIVTGDELMNNVDYGGERDISDIIYFATALPNGG